MNTPAPPEHVIRVVAQSICGTRPTMQATINLTRIVLRDGIPGDLVECGVYAGGHPALMASVLHQAKDQERKVHLFDSFEGIPEAGEHDTEQPGIGPKAPDAQGRLVSTGVSVCAMEKVQERLRFLGFPDERFVYHKGWFQHTVPKAEIGEIALLRLDGDLYESTMVCLQYLYPRLSEGGICIVDDYALGGCRKACDRYLNSIHSTPTIIKIEGGRGPVWWVKEQADG